MLVASTSVSGFNCATPAANSQRTPLPCVGVRSSWDQRPASTATAGRTGAAAHLYDPPDDYALHSAQRV
jgi:hypothetical protein